MSLSRFSGRKRVEKREGERRRGHGNDTRNSKRTERKNSAVESTETVRRTRVSDAEMITLSKYNVIVIVISRTSAAPSRNFCKLFIRNLSRELFRVLKIS